MKADLASFLDIPDSYEVLVMQGPRSEILRLQWADIFKVEDLVNSLRRHTI